MRQLNAHGAMRILVPQGFTKKGRAVLRGAAISDENHNYLGWWDAADMNRETKRQLQRELDENWFPALYDREAL